MAHWVYRRLFVESSQKMDGAGDFRVLQDGDTEFRNPASFVPKRDSRPILMEYLNKLGEDGWELVTLTPFVGLGTQSLSTIAYHIAILKRLEQDTP